MRIVFMGTPSFAVASLEALVRAGHQVAGVFSQPDKPVGRHQNKLQPTPVKECAQAHGIPVYQPEKLRDGTALALLRELDPELIVAAAYGRILPDDILALPPKGCINVHSSLLPKYRGSAPINWAILNGDRETGVTIQKMVRDLDAGDIILQRATPIGADENAAALYDRLALMGGELLTQAVAQIEAGIAACTPQDHAQATQAPMLSKALSPVDWTRSAQAIHNQIRGLYPWPAAATDILTGEPVKLWAARTAETPAAARPGTIISAGREGIDVACGDGRALRILELQAPGGKRMSAADYLRGHPIQI
jgi:methionyl-tRNA formyltransferase